MSYTALYRKWRPHNFEDVKGQDHIITTLKNQIKADRIGHAYLFCGTRGTGKTTIAKIFAKAVNCENPVNGSPCNECESCRSITKGRSMNVIEIDAASNNGVDNIREIKDEVSYSPTEGRYKVYIIDEVHMLSIGAFNALLKTLEEPPSYVIFILATTESHKIPVTILSRCQRYDFKRITIDIITERLQELMTEEKVEAEEKALRYVAKAAEGSMRDALSLLDQCIAFYLGEKLTYEHVLEVLGAVDTEVFSRLLRDILNKEVTSAIKILEELIVQGRELGQFVTDFIWYLRNLLLAKTSDNIEDIIDVSAESMVRLKEEGTMTDENTLMRYIRVFSETSNQIKYASHKRILIEMSIIKLCKPEMEMNLDSIIERLNHMEQKIENGMVIQARPEQTPPDSGFAAREGKKEPKVIPKAIPEDIKTIVTNWKTISNQAPPSMKPYLKTSRLSLGGENRLQIIVEDEVAEGFLKTEDHKAEIESLIARKTGKAVEVEIRLLGNGRSFEETYVNLEKIFSDEIKMEITIEDE